MLTMKHLVNESYLRPRFKLDCEQTLFVKHTAARSDMAKSNVEQVVNFSDRMLLYPLTQNRGKSHRDFFFLSLQVFNLRKEADRAGLFSEWA